MPRIKAVSEASDEALEKLIDEIRSERGGKLLLLYQVLLNSPPVARGWLKLLTAIRQQTSLPGALRELVILRIAILNGASYEFEAHAPIAIAEGLDKGWIGELSRGGTPDGMPEREKAVLAYTDAMTRDITVPEQTYRAMAAHFDERQILELTATIAAYNMVSRLLVALEVHAEHT
ncbi:carboxymuconolactone decarboxylase family protein [Aquibium sp. LZ166]|uniref:Carboxymuconolactone decarboxylase family protein n=1 Tax=Aquibium pacificus TaxID=3153579 RepID=A0ABV3SL43_9HYPH